MNAFDERIIKQFPGGLISENISLLQVNLGRKCNLSCTHCHLDCSPSRTEMMTREIMQQVVSLAKCSDFKLVDITGGAPELNTDFRWFIESLRDIGKAVQVRTNLAWLDEQADDNISGFLYDNKVSLVGSLPCYMEENVDAQRGGGTYRKSVSAIKRLNELGYGTEDGLQLHLVYNPSGAFLGGCQEQLEQAYKKELSDRFDITFSSLIVITNMPIGRFSSKLQEENQEENYMKLLTDSFNPETITHLMCRHQLCVDWDGALYDCDFNIALGIKLNHSTPLSLNSAINELTSIRSIETGNHCFGCSAGSGSSCSGSLTS